MKPLHVLCLVLVILASSPAVFAQAASPPSGAAGVVERTEKAVAHGAQVAAKGVETGAQAAARAIQRGASVAASGVERGIKAAASVASNVAGKVTGTTASAPKP